MIVLLGCTIVFLGYLFVVCINLPPLVRSNNVSVHGNMLYIAGTGVLGSAMAMTALILHPIAPQIGTLPARIVMVEAFLILIVSVVLLGQSLSFFGLV